MSLAPRETHGIFRSTVMRATQTGPTTREAAAVPMSRCHSRTTGVAYNGGQNVRIWQVLVAAGGADVCPVAGRRTRRRNRVRHRMRGLVRADEVSTGNGHPVRGFPRFR